MRATATETRLLHVTVTAHPAGSGHTSTRPRFAIVSHRDNPAADEWKTGDWQGDTARILIGPGTDVVLSRGDYRVWLAIEAGEERVVRKAGSLSVT